MASRITFPAVPSISAERARVHELLERHGWNASSFQILSSDFAYWFDGEEACVAYVDTGRAWVAAGAPICAADRLADTALKFVAEARRRRRRVSFFGTEARFQSLVPFGQLYIGEQPVWDPRCWEQTVRGSPSLREQLRRARAKAVAVRELLPAELADEGGRMRRELQALQRRWIEACRLPAMRFLVQVEPFAFLDRKRCFLAEQHRAQVGLLVAVPVYERQGWLFEHLLRDARTPNGATELLIDHAMRAVAEDGSAYVTLGLVPLAGPVAAALRFARFAGQGFYDFEGLRRFKTRLRPARWTPIFLGVPRGDSRAVAVYDVLRAFAGKSLVRFGWDALWSKPPFLARLLALSLVPWTGALALAGPRTWFPGTGVWLAWIAFDLGLIAALLRLARRWRRGLARTLAGLVTADAVVTLAEAIAYNLPRVTSAWQPAVAAVAVLGPSAAAVFLWHAVLGPEGRAVQPPASAQPPSTQ